MKRALGPAGLAALDECRRRGALLAFDFDGTLAPIVAEPSRAAMRPDTRRLLARLARRQPCAVLSGRSSQDLARRLRGVALVERVGNHGVEYGLRPAARAAALERVARWRATLSRRLAGCKGVVIEDNGVSLAVHFRRSPDRAAARQAIRRAIASLDGVRLLPGKCVLNVLPAGGALKGRALRAMARRRRARCVLYVGDDVTDEDAFTTPAARRYVTVRVGRHAGSAADYFLSGQRRIDDLLLALLEEPARRGGWRRSRRVP